MTTGGELPRVIGPGRFALMVVGLTIGTAIFRVPSVVAANAGSPGVTALLWLLGAAFAVSGGLASAELAARLPKAGGEYALIKAAYGDRLGFVFGWSWLLLGSPASIAAVARTFVDYGASITPIDEPARRALTVVVIALHCALAMASTRAASRLSGAATGAKIGALALVALAAFLLPARPGPPGAGLPAGAGTPSAIIAGLVAVIWAYDGTSLVYLAGDVRDPSRSIPRGLMLGTGLVVAIYAAVNLAYGHTLGFAGLAGSSAVAADTMGALLGRGGAVLVAGLVMLSSYSCGMVQLVGHPRVTFALASDGLFVRRMAALSRRTQTPWLAILLHGSLAAVLALSGGYEFLIRLVVFSFYPLLGATYAGAIVLRRREGPPAGFRMPLYPAPLAFYLVMLSVVLVVSLVDDPVALGYSAIITAAGWVVSKRVVARAARQPITPEASRGDPTGASSR
jgi:APA family basic amino acid/polyamine antiporter